MSVEFPAWFQPEVMNADSFWAAAVQTTLSRFFESYSLHDCEWLGLSVDPRYDGDGVAAFELDTFWYREQMPKAHKAGWAALIVRFERVRTITLSGFKEDEASPRTIDAAECHHDGQVAVLAVADIYGGSVEVAHSAEVKLLCLTWDGEALAIPGLAAS